MHAANFRAIGFDGDYGAFDVAPGELLDALRRFAGEGYLGINCTIPHKEAVLPLMTRLDASAIRCAAVNTVKFEPDGATVGYNTDCAGFRLSLEEAGFPFAERKVVLLGAGGAARAVAVACLDAGCSSLAVANRTYAKAESLVAALAGVGGGNVRALGGTDAPETRQALREADLIVNATSIGLKAEDPSAVPFELLRKGQTVCDIIPVRRETATLAAARMAGAKAVGGLGMLVHQGAAAFRIWTGFEPDVTAMRRAIS
jgi:shikimate dehydrogenase